MPLKIVPELEMNPTKRGGALFSILTPTLLYGFELLFYRCHYPPFQLFLSRHLEDCFSRAHQCAGGAISGHDRHRLSGARGGNRIRCLCLRWHLLHRGVYAHLGLLFGRTNLDGSSQWRAELPRHWCGVLSQSSVSQRHFHSNSDHHPNLGSLSAVSRHQ